MIFMRPTDGAKLVMKKWIDELQAQPWSKLKKSNDQPAFNWALNKTAGQVILFNGHAFARSQSDVMCACFKCDLYIECAFPPILFVSQNLSLMHPLHLSAVTFASSTPFKAWGWHQFWKSLIIFLQVDLYLLPQAAFPTGGLYFKNETWVQETKGRHVIIHNNYITGFEKKIKRFREFGLWLVDDHVFESPLGRL